MKCLDVLHARAERERTMRSLEERGRRARNALAVLLVAIATASSCSSSGEGLGDRQPKARQIVSSHAESAFETFFSREDAEDRAAFTNFQEQTLTAANRTDLEAAWQAILRLNEKGADFLPRRVFAKAEADGDWPGGEIDEKQVYVGGVQDGVAAFLTTEPG